MIKHAISVLYVVGVCFVGGIRIMALPAEFALWRLFG